MIYQLILGIWLVGLYSSPNAQLIMLILTNICHLAYTLKVRPYLNNINLIFNILSTLCIIAFESYFIYFFNNGSKMFANQKYNIAYPFLIVVDIFCVLMVLWGFWRFIWEINLYVKNFKGTLLYLEFADHDYVG